MLPANAASMSASVGCGVRASNAAADMIYRRVTSCSCDDEPENSTCSSNTAYHDEYYDSIGWPTVIPRHTLVFGDGNGADGFAKLGSGTLYDFYYTGAFCSEDMDWSGTQRDCNAGSRDITAAMVNTDEGASERQPGPPTAALAGAQHRVSGANQRQNVEGFRQIEPVHRHRDRRQGQHETGNRRCRNAEVALRRMPDQPHAGSTRDRAG